MRSNASDLTDSVQKIISTYFTSITKEPFEWRGKIYTPKKLRVSPGIFYKRMICHPNCGGCCRAFTLDWLPSELETIPETEKGEEFGPREIEFNGSTFTIYSDLNKGHESYYCKNLNQTKNNAD